MVDALATGDQFFGASANPVAPTAGLPTGADFLDGAPPQSGAAHDTVWSSLLTAGSRILNSAGYGAQNEWGAAPLGLSPDAEAGLRKAGVFNDYATGHTNFLKSANEALIRPAAALADFAISRGFGIPAVAGAVSGGLQQAQQEVQGAHPNVAQQVVGTALGGAGELAGGFAEGAFIGALGEGIPRAAEATHVDTAARARSVGVLGEGEAGFYGAEPLTPENVQARTDAAKDAGLDAPPPPTPPAPDIHVLARRIDPETFEQFDALAVQREEHRVTIAALGEERENSPEAVQARADVDTILGKVNGVADRLTKAAAQRLADAQARLDAATGADTLAMSAARGKLLETDFAMRDLAPDVSEAYRRAADMAPQLVEPLVEEAKPAEGVKNVEAENVSTNVLSEQPHPAAVLASSEVAGFDPPNVVGEQKLGAEPTEEGAEAAPNAKTSGARYGNLRDVEGEGDLQTRGLAESAEASAIKAGLTDTFGDLPEYRTLGNEGQFAAVVKFMDQDWEMAKAIAMGDRQPPKGVLPESFYVGVLKRAETTGDVDTALKLATRSKLITAGTTMGRRLQMLSNIDKDSPTAAIQEVQAAREADLAKRTNLQAAKASEVAEIRKEVRKAASSKDAWAEFITGIKC